MRAAGLLALFIAATAAAGQAVTLDGPTPLVSSVAQALAARGVPTGAGAAARAVWVRLASVPEGVRLTLRDPDGRTADRVVATPEIAAAVIDSWARSELADPLLTPRVPFRNDPAPVVTAAPRPSRSPVLEAAGQTAVAWDGSLWLGAGLGACLPVGPLCLGLAGRLASGTGAGAPSALFRASQPAALRRSEVMALATAELPLRLGRPLLIVGAGLGLGRFSTTASSGGYQGQAVSLGLRAEGRAALALPIWSRLALVLELAAGLAPMAARQAVKAGYFSLPGQPLGQLRAGLGARWGMP